MNLFSYFSVLKIPGCFKTLISTRKSLSSWGPWGDRLVTLTTLRTDRNLFLSKFVLYFFFFFWRFSVETYINLHSNFPVQTHSLTHTNWHTLEKVASHKFTFITQYLIHVNFNIINNCHDRNPIVLSRHKISYSRSSGTRPPRED